MRPNEERRRSVGLGVTVVERNITPFQSIPIIHKKDHENLI